MKHLFFFAFFFAARQQCRFCCARWDRRYGAPGKQVQAFSFQNVSFFYELWIFTRCGVVLGFAFPDLIPVSSWFGATVERDLKNYFLSYIEGLRGVYRFATLFLIGAFILLLYFLYFYPVHSVAFMSKLRSHFVRLLKLIGFSCVMSFNTDAVRGMRQWFSRFPSVDATGITCTTNNGSKKSTGGETLLRIEWNRAIVILHRTKGNNMP